MPGIFRTTKSSQVLLCCIRLRCSMPTARKSTSPALALLSVLSNPSFQSVFPIRLSNPSFQSVFPCPSTALAVGKNCEERFALLPRVYRLNRYYPVVAALISGRIYNGIENCEQHFCENIFGARMTITKQRLKLVLPSYFSSERCANFWSRKHRGMPAKMELRYNAPLFAALHNACTTSVNTAIEGCRQHAHL